MIMLIGGMIGLLKMVFWMYVNIVSLVCVIIIGYWLSLWDVIVVVMLFYYGYGLIVLLFVILVFGGVVLLFVCG